MFITTPDAEHVLISALFGPDGTRQWTYLELALAVPWFCIQFWQAEDGARIRRTFQLSDHQQLNSLLEVQDIEITSVDVALPSNYTGKEGWTMQPLRAIWRGTAPDGTRQEVYVSRSGRRFTPDESVLHERDLVDRQRVFSWRRVAKADEEGQSDDSGLDGTLIL